MELTKGKILNEKGILNDQGYSFENLKLYNKSNVPSIYKSRVKEWDYYSFSNEKMAFLLTIANNTYMSYVSCSFVDYENKTHVTKSYLSLGGSKIKLPITPLHHDIEIKDSRFYISVKKGDINTKIIAKLNNFLKSKDLLLNLKVTNKNQGNGIYMLHPFKNKHHFYYNFKENLLMTKGTIALGKTKNEFEGCGVYDWGRGIWPYKTEWFWISLNSLKGIGFNLGCGFGSSLESENVVYYNHTKYKLADLILEAPKNNKGKINYLENWQLKSSDGNIDLIFTPVVNRHDALNFGLFSTTQNQVFGKFSGKIKTKEKVLEFNDELGFIEHFKNRW